MQRVALLNWNNINQDYDLSAIFEAFANVSLWWVINWLELNNWVITPWRAFVKVNRNWRQFFVLFENTEDVSIDTSTDGKIFIKINEANIVDGTANNEDGTWIWQIVKDTNFPTANYLPLAEIVWGSVNDLREFVKLDEKVLEGLNADKLDFSSMSKDITTTWTITAQSFVWDGSWLTNLPPSTPFYFGDWSDWDLVVTSWTTNLNLNQVYQFSSISIASGTVLSTADKVWLMILHCKWDCQIDWEINLDGVGRDRKWIFIDLLWIQLYWWEWWNGWDWWYKWWVAWQWWDEYWIWWWGGWGWASAGGWNWWNGWNWDVLFWYWGAWCEVGTNTKGWDWWDPNEDWWTWYWGTWSTAWCTWENWVGWGWWWGWAWRNSDYRAYGWWGGWGWLSGGILLLYSNSISWSWTINVNWWNWWNWWNWDLNYSRWAGWGWGWGWGWGGIALILTADNNSSYTLNVNWWNWWNWWSWKASWEEWKNWLSWTSWEYLIFKT